MTKYPELKKTEGNVDFPNLSTHFWGRVFLGRQIVRILQYMELARKTEKFMQKKKKIKGIRKAEAKFEKVGGNENSTKD